MKIKELIKQIIKESNNNNINTLKQKNLNDNFWKWFGNSKTIENNTPIICYHGTDTEFNSFSKNKIGSVHWQSKTNAYGGGFFFVDKERYAHNRGVLKTVYLKIENPLIRTAGDIYYAQDMYDNNTNYFMQKAKEDGNDGIIIKSTNANLYI